MGVDITTYRSRIGTYKHGNGIDVCTEYIFVDFSGCFRVIGSVAFIGTLLIIAGIESNPGPKITDTIGVTIFTCWNRIGTYKHGNDIDFCSGNVVFFYICECFREIGAVAFIGSLLIIAGIESNPGPKAADIVIFATAIAVVLLGIYISNKHAFYVSWEKWLVLLVTIVTASAFMRSTIFQRKQRENSDTKEHDEKNTNVTENVTEHDDYLESEEPLANPTLHRDAKRMLEELGLQNRFPGKFHIRDLLTVCPGENKSQPNSVKEIPWIFLKKILSMNSDAMDIRSYSSDNRRSTKSYSVSELYENSSGNETIESVSPLDLLLLVFQCCDPMLKQIIFAKLYLCKLAVPFLHLHCFSKPVVSVWPLRSIVISYEREKTLYEESVLDLPIKVLSVARFGRPNMSKSKLLNRIIGNTSTFFHRDCPCGTKPRFLSAGYVEMFFMPSVGDKKEMFDSSVTFLNMRGDIKSDYNDKCQQFISKISNLIAIVCDINSIKQDKSSLCEIIFKFSALILIIASPLDVDDELARSSLEELERNVTDEGLTKLKILCTHNHKIEKNSTELMTEISANMSELLKADAHSEPLAKRIKTYSKIAPASDEGTAACVEAKSAAYTVIQAMGKTSAQETWLKTFTPVQTLSCDLSEILKQQYRCSQEFKKIESIKENIRSIRIKQLDQISKPMHLFINSLVKYKGSQTLLQYFLGWLHYFLEHEKRTVLPTLMQENHSAWDRYRQKKKENKVTTAELNKYEMSIKEVEGKIEKASFGLDNLFRELGQICDAAIFLGIKKTQIVYKLPSISLLADITAQLVCSGQIFELLDGNSFYMPQEWIKMVFRRVNTLLGNKKVFVLSVLGVQSSGKSTLLNTMFGLQLSASSGRCTKGIHSQLIPKQKTNKNPFEYVLVIDTEGLRAPELSERNYQRDNELSTIITGLGDVTLLNVMGENSVEIRDILQIIVHALLRIKLANNTLDIHKSCFFIHQNVADISARDKMKTGLQLLVRNLDTATKEAAESEGISDITTFNQVIEFETEKDVWYLPNLWLGNPPMARVNGNYSEKVVEIKMNLIDKAMNATDKSFKTLEDIVTHTEDLWKAVLAEDFVFSFRNSLEKKAYIELEKKMKQELWNLDSVLDDTIYQLVHNEFSQCDTLERLRESKSKVTLKIQSLVADKGNNARENLQSFFKDNNYKDTIIQWKQQSLNRLKLYCEELIVKKKEEMYRLLSKREVDIMITLMHTKHEEELREKSMELANELKGKNIGLQEIDDKFEQIWARFVYESVSSTTLKNTDISLKDQFISCLFDIIGHHTVLFQVLNEHSMLMKDLHLNNLSGSFEMTNVTEKDISLKSNIRRVIKRIPVFNVFESSYNLSKDAFENMFRSFDTKISNICKRDNEITDRDIKGFMNNVKTSFDDVQYSNADKFSLKSSCIIKCFVHVSSFACSHFEAANARYQNSHGVNARLARYKSQVKDRFDAHLNDRKAEETAAILLRHALENSIKDTIKGSMSTKVKLYLRGHLPMLKYQLIIDILTDLVHQQSFLSFRKYIQSAISYAESWVTEKADNLLFLNHSGSYAVLAETEIDTCFEDIFQSISKVSKILPDSFLSIEEWLNNFMLFLGKYKFPKECFRDVSREQDRFVHLHRKHFEEHIRKELADLKVSLTQVFKSETKQNVRWWGFNPVEEIFNDIWGCQEQCCFCGEPCTRGSRHESTSHNCLQHRPAGCDGTHNKDTRKIWLRSCNFDVTTNVTYNCYVFRYRCNPVDKKECSLERHPISSYREYLPDWDIEPTTDMEERSQFWMWYIAKYKTDIAKYYEVNVSNVPSSWDKITEEQALSSLRRLYAKDDEIKSDLQI